jgi:polysaccharide biosynthesis transport protein
MKPAENTSELIGSYRRPRPQVLGANGPIEASLRSAPLPIDGSSLAGHPAPTAMPGAIPLLRALRRRWRLSLVLGLLGSTTAAYLAMKLTPPAKYTARSVLQVSTYTPKIIFDTTARSAVYTTYQKTQVVLIKSRRVLNAALQRPEVASVATLKEQPDAVEWLEEAIKVDFPGGSELLQISLSGMHPGDLAVLVNAVTDSYLETIESMERSERTERLEALKVLYHTYQKDLEAKRKMIRDLAAAVGSSDKQTLALQQQFAMQQLSGAKNDLARLGSDLRAARLDLSVLETRSRNRSATSSHDADIQAAIATDPEIRDSRAKLQSLEGRLRSAQHKIRDPLDPAVVTLRRDYEVTRARLAAQEASHRREIPEANRQASQAKQDEEIAQVQARIAALIESDRSLRAEIAQLAEESISVSKGTLDLQTHQDEIALLSETTKKVGTEVEAMEVERGAKPRISRLDKAEVPRKKDETRQLKISAGAAASTFAAILFGVSYWEFCGRRINTTDEVTKSLGMRLVGCLPDYRRRPSPRHAEQDATWNNRLVDSIDATRTMLLHLSRAESIKIVMVTSAIKGEGKTSLSGHLATSLARAGRRTLLIDCDLRSPTVHRLFDLAPGPGLSEVLRGEAKIAETVRPTPSTDLFVIPSGRVDPEAIQALAQECLRTAFDSLRRDFDFVIVDSAPILPLVDSLLIGQQVDAVIFSLMRDVSRVPMVHAAYERLAMLGIRMLGAVINGTEGGLEHGTYANHATPITLAVRA